MKLIRATSEEKDAYDGLYPLYGYLVPKDEPRRIVEKMDNTQYGDPKYDVLIPRGWVVDDCHTLACFSIREVKSWGSQPGRECEGDNCGCLVLHQGGE